MEVIEHLKCPVCGEGIGEMHLIHKDSIEDAAKAGIIFTPAAQVNVYISLVPHKKPLVGGRIPAHRAYLEICEKCGAMWVFRVERGHVTYTGDPRMPMKDFK